MCYRSVSTSEAVLPSLWRGHASGMGVIRAAYQSMSMWWWLVGIVALGALVWVLSAPNSRRKMGRPGGRSPKNGKDTE